MQKTQLTFGMDLPPGFGCGRPMSVSEYARRRGVSHFAVQRAIKDGRLTPESVIVDFRGHPKILDPIKADEEWDANTKPTPGEEPHNGDGGRSSLTRETIKERKWKAKLAELEYLRKSGALMPVRDAQHGWSVKVVEARTAFLGLPNRLKQLLQHLTLEDVAVIDREVRQILHELAYGHRDDANGGVPGGLDADSALVGAAAAAPALAVGG